MNQLNSLTPALNARKATASNGNFPLSMHSILLGDISPKDRRFPLSCSYITQPSFVRAQRRKVTKKE